MNTFNKGFTLIELLVTVLIIGALISIALPQYDRAVLRSRAAEVWTVLPTIRAATEAYCLANGGGYPQVEDLSIDFPSQRRNFAINLNSCYSFASGYGKVTAIFYYDKNGGRVNLSLNQKGTKYCSEYVPRDSSDDSVCRKLGFENGYKSCGSGGGDCSWSFTE